MNDFVLTPPKVLQSSLLCSVEGVSHGFFGRQGGVSSGLFDSLNCSSFSGDAPDAIIENRLRIRDNLSATKLLSNKQVHGNHVRLVDQTTDDAGVYLGDGLVTLSPNIALGALGADCAPVLFADNQSRIIGAAHAGWGGALKGVTDKVIELMVAQGASVDSICASIGPTIQLSSYEVGYEFRDRFVAQSPINADGCFTTLGAKQTVHFDLPLYIERRLQAVGLQHIDRLQVDTYAQEADFFSYRRSCHRQEPVYGRQMGAIALTK